MITTTLLLTDDDGVTTAESLDVYDTLEQAIQGAVEIGWEYNDDPEELLGSSVLFSQGNRPAALLSYRPTNGMPDIVINFMSGGYSLYRRVPHGDIYRAEQIA